MEAARRRRRPVEDALAAAHDRSTLALQLQRTIGNRAAARILARKPTVDQVAVLMSYGGNSDITQAGLGTLLGDVTTAGADYVAMDPTDQEGRPGLGALELLKTRAQELDRQVIRLRERIGDVGNQTELHHARQAVVALFNDANSEHAKLRRRLNKEEYDKEVEPNTIKQLDARAAKYMLITTRPGSEESEARGPSEYPSDVPVDKKMTLALPGRVSQTAPINQIQTDGKAVSELDVLVIAGSHGGVRALFEQEGVGTFSADYWSKNVVPQLSQRVRAHHIVLDACLTASMIDVFRPLLTTGGKIVCSMYSVNGRFMTPELWKAIIKEAGEQGSTQKVGGLLDQRLQTFKTEVRANTAEALVSNIKSSDPSELATLLKNEPTSEELISKIRYLPRLHNAISGFIAGNQTCEDASNNVSDVLGETPTPASDEMSLGATLMSLLSDNTAERRTAVANEFRQALQTLTNTNEQDLEALVTGGRAKAQTDAATNEATNAPTHLAVFDNPTSTLVYDEQIEKWEGVERVTYSTGGASRGEIARLRQEIAKLGITLSAQSVTNLKL
jgi:hypothetical protein